MCSTQPLPTARLALHLISHVWLRPLKVSPSSHEVQGLVKRPGMDAKFFKHDERLSLSVHLLKVVKPPPFQISGTRVKGASQNDRRTREGKIRRVKVGDESGGR